MFSGAEILQRFFYFVTFSKNYGKHLQDTSENLVGITIFMLQITSAKIPHRYVNNYFLIFLNIFRLNYCRIQRNWRLGFNLSCEACDNPISLNFLLNNLVLICINFWWLQNFSDHRWFFWSGQKKKWQGFSNFFQNGQLERNFLCYESCRKNPFGYFFYFSDT